MALKRELMKALDDSDQPISKRIKIANNAFMSSEILLQHKEVILILWLLKNIDGSNKEAFELLEGWLRSPQFKQLNRNDVDNKEMEDIIDVVIEKISIMRTITEKPENICTETLQQLLHNAMFQHCFKLNIQVYCKLISSVIDTMNCPSALIGFLNNNTFSKNMITNEEKFLKYFLNTVMPSFVQWLLKHEDINVFKQFSKIIQKCIFYNNRKSFTGYIGIFFEDTKPESSAMPKAVIKNILEIYKLDTKFSKIYLKLLFHAFSTTYENDFELIYKFFAIFIHILGFDLNQKLLFHKCSKLQLLEDEIVLSKSQEILSGLLDVLAEVQIDLKCTVREIPFKDFLSNIVVEFLGFNIPDAVSYKIILKAISINPLIVETLIEDIIVYAMKANNEHCEKEYEVLITSIFDVYSKLHRIENLVSKMMEALNEGFNDTTSKIDELYVFRGQRDLEVKCKVEFNINDILTENILKCFSSCISSLASWQIINIFKTLIFHLNKILGNIQNINNDNANYCTFMTALSKLLSTFLSSIRVAEHTVSTNVVEKCVKCLNELQDSLKTFGHSLVKREHNHLLMWSFLNIAYHWAELYMVLKYYSLNSTNNTLNGSLGNDFTSANITYLHPYLSVKEWHLLSERITNFGEQPCKQFLYKLYVQKIRALNLFEENFTEDILTNVVRSMTTHLEEDWRIILEDKFVINNLLLKTDISVVITLVENLVNDIEKLDKFEKCQPLLDSPLILNVVNYTVLMKLNKIFSKHKRKLNENTPHKLLSSKIFSLFSGGEFLSDDSNCIEIVEKAKKIYATENVLGKDIEIKFNEDKTCNYLKVLNEFPIIYSREIVQKAGLLYLFSLHKDLAYKFSEGIYKKLQSMVEDLIKGILQNIKFKLEDILQIDVVCVDILENFSSWEEPFTLITENVFKTEHFVNYYEPLVTTLVEKLHQPDYMQSSIIIMNSINKLKKSKMPKEVKNTAEKYRTRICEKILELSLTKSPEDSLLTGYAYILRHYISQNNNEKLPDILDKLNTYLEYALNNRAKYGTAEFLVLFITVLQNKSKIKDFDNGYILKIWNACKESSSVYTKFEEYSQLVVLIVSHIHDEFSEIINNLLDISQTSINCGNFELFANNLKTWQAILLCNMNPVKTKILQGALEKLLQKTVLLLKEEQYDSKLYESLMEFQKVIIQTNHVHLTFALIDSLILCLSVLIDKEDQDFSNRINFSISLLSILLKYRKPLVMDRLPPYLQVYRTILRKLCKKSNSDLHLDESTILELADCAHQLEKLTRNLVVYQKDMGRIAMYLIADILQQYEQVSLYPNIKLHLNNCIYSLISICDQHAVAYLMRVLSSASTEIFKLMYENYKKYYRFTGKI